MVGDILVKDLSNYMDFAESINMNLDAVVPFLLTPEGALLSAFYYWRKNDLNRFADKKDIIGLTKAINGGTIGLDDRIKRFLVNVKILNEL